jgi:hypothetical protein
MEITRHPIIILINILCTFWYINILQGQKQAGEPMQGEQKNKKVFCNFG